MKALLRSFGYAFRGLAVATRTERSFRIHIVIMIYMFGILLPTDWFVLTPEGWALLLLASALVVATELLNTAIEATVDLVTEGRYHRFAAMAKDTASASVLASGLFAIAVGIALLGQPEAFRKMAAYFASHPVMLTAVAISLGIAGLFIFRGGGRGVGTSSTTPAAEPGDRQSAEPVP
jgi:undecaprenol kinase